MPRSRFIRRTSLLMTSTSSLVAVALALVLIAAFALRSVDRPSHVRIAVVPADNADMLFAEALGRELPKGFQSSEVSLVQAANLKDIATVVDANRAELAIARTDVALPHHAGTLLVVHHDAALFMALPDAKIKELSDLENKKVGVVPAGSANMALANTVLTQNGLDETEVTRIALARDAVADAIAKKEIDALVVIAPVGSDLLREMVETMSVADKPPVFLPVENAEALEQGLYGFTKTTIPSGLFAGSPPQPEKEVETVGVDYQLVARNDMSDAAAGLLTRTILALRRALADTAPIANFMQAPDTDKGSRYPMHAGAIAFYADNEKTFMDRYGDWFYIVAMVAGGIGSALASLIASLQARSRRSAMVIIDHLGQLRRNAAECTEQSALRSIDREVSELALAALSRARDGRFDQSGLEILRLAIEETRRAITRRLAELRSNAPVSTPALPAQAAQ